jgi:dynein heavy chain, axonemal
LNFQYAFSLREILSILYGVATATPSQFQKPSSLVQLWLYETLRVYADRMSGERDHSRMIQLATEHCKRAFDADLNDGSKATASGPLFIPFKLEEVGFGCTAATAPLVSQVTDWDSTRLALYGALKVGASPEGLLPFVFTLLRYLQQYNETEATMELVLFDRAVEHVVNAARLLCRPKGHLLLVGVGGSGKQSLLRLAAFVCGVPVRSPGISASYSLNEFVDQLKGTHTQPAALGDLLLVPFPLCVTFRVV